MTGREIVRRAIEFEGPERLPIGSEVFGESDFCYLSLKTPRYTPRVPGAREWGYTMKQSEIPNHGVPADLPIATWEMLEDYAWPDAANPERYDGIGERLDSPAAAGKYAYVSWFVGLYDMVLRLRGWEESMLDFAAEPEKIKYVVARVAEFITTAIDTLAEKFPGRIHGIMIPDDWGGQDATFMSIEMWEEFFGGHYREIARHMHEGGMHFWLHSDGRINALVDTLIECGVDVLNMPSPTVVGIDEVARDFVGRICLANGVDIQTTMISGSDEEIREEARELVEKWGTGRGGFIPSCGMNLSAIGGNAHRWLVAANALREYGWGLPPLTQEEADRYRARLT